MSKRDRAKTEAADPYDLGYALGDQVGVDNVLKYPEVQEDQYMLDCAQFARARRLENPPENSSEWAGQEWRAFHTGVLAGLRAVWQAVSKTPF